MSFIIKYTLLSLCICLFNVKIVHTQNNETVTTHAVEPTTNAVEPTTTHAVEPTTIQSFESVSTTLNPTDSVTQTMTINPSVTFTTALNMTSISISTATESMTALLPSSSVILLPTLPPLPPNNVRETNNKYQGRI